ncbi:MAG: hypothetical protein SAJ37_18405 [Oscillatoria sp. PMC 1068.18]|nr:hypothetical protein [Oscillatoria sp. PMC 1076.18]MEC4990708.1 hypothetical protein [Oscillatoria sp. PMC 1068.18]
MISEVIACSEWLERLITKKYIIAISEMTTYETKRDHFRRIQSPKCSNAEKQNAEKAIEELNKLINMKGVIHYPVTSEEDNVMEEAAKLWAFARNNSWVAYDADLIIAAQAVILKRIGIDVIIATTDTQDFNRLLKQHHIDARRWQDIST